MHKVVGWFVSVCVSALRLGFLKACNNQALKRLIQAQCDNISMLMVLKFRIKALFLVKA